MGIDDEDKMPNSLAGLKAKSFKDERVKKESASSTSKLSEFEKDQLKAGFGVKADSQKPRMDLIPPEVMFGYGRALGYGAKKYSDHNWLNGMKWGRMFGAAMRHLWAFWFGEEHDEESKLHHLESAIFSICALYVYVLRGIGEDTRKTVDAETRKRIKEMWEQFDEE